MNKELFNDYIKGLSITELSHKYKVSKTRVYKEIAEYSVKQNKILSIIKNKDVDMFMLKSVSCASVYNATLEKTFYKVDDYRFLTQEEFDLLKGV